MYALRIAALDHYIEDPRSYIRYIPWEELASTSDEELQCSGLNLDIPFSQGSETTSWVLWSPPLPGFAWNHHFRSDDEVYEYHVTRGWPSPDHYVSRQPDKILFGARQLDETGFVADLGSYWAAWVSHIGSLVRSGLLPLEERLRNHCERRHRSSAFA